MCNDSESVPQISFSEDFDSLGAPQKKFETTAIDSKRAEDYKVSPQTIVEQKIEVTPVDK